MNEETYSQLKALGVPKSGPEHRGALSVFAHPISPSPRFTTKSASRSPHSVPRNSRARPVGRSFYQS